MPPEMNDDVLQEFAQIKVAMSALSDSRRQWSSPQFLLQLLGVIVANVIAGIIAFQLLKSDQRSDHEALQRIQSDVAALKQSLPNTAVYDVKIHEIELSVAALRDDLNVEKLRAQQLREKLLVKRLIN